MAVKKVTPPKAASEMLKALGHPARLTIALGLCHKECNVSKMVEKLGLPQSTVSQHLRVLRQSGIVTAKKEGVSTCYWVNHPLAKKILDHIRTSMEEERYATF